MSRRGTKRNGDTNQLVDILLPFVQERVPDIERDACRARVTNLAKKAGFIGVGELVDELCKPVRAKTNSTKSSKEEKMVLIDGRPAKITYLD